MNAEERASTLLVVLIADDEGPHSQFVAEQLHNVRSEFSQEIDSGLLHVIVPPREWYPPDLRSIPATFDDSPEREYYLQLEDDILTKRGFVSRIHDFTAQRPIESQWFMLEFSTLGFIGKLFRSSDLPLLAQFIALFHREKPVDWLLDLLFVNRYCHPEKSPKQCSEITKQYRVRSRPSLFQHVGVHSSLAGKLQKLRERDFGKVQLYIPHADNPRAKISTSLVGYKSYDLESAYAGRNFFWSLSPRAEDYILFDFGQGIKIHGFLFRTGNPEHQGDILTEDASVYLRRKNSGNFDRIVAFNEHGTARVDFNVMVESEQTCSEWHCWWVAASGVIILLIEGGIRPMLVIHFNSFQEDLKWSKSTFSTVIAVINASSLLSGPLAAAFYQLLGARLSISAGALATGIGFVLVSLSSSLFLIIIISAIIGVGCGVIRTAIVSVQCEYFMKNRDFTMALIFIGPGIGQFLFAHILNYLNNLLSWRSSWRLIAIIFLCCVPLALPFKRKMKQAKENEIAQFLGIKVLRKPEFLIQLIAVFFAASLCISYYIFEVPMMVESGIDRDTAASVFSSQGIASIAGRVLTTLLIRSGKMHIAIVMLSCYAIAESSKLADWYGVMAAFSVAAKLGVMSIIACIVAVIVIMWQERNSRIHQPVSMEAVLEKEASENKCLFLYQILAVSVFLEKLKAVNASARSAHWRAQGVLHFVIEILRSCTPTLPHEWFVSEAKGKEADVLFIGDDHIALFEQSFVYREHFAPLHCLCFGALGDRITDLRWRLENKVLEGLNPKVIVVSTGNLDYGLSKDELLNGMKEVAEIIKRQKPMSRIFFMKLLPSGRRPNKRRELVSSVNDAMETALHGVADVIDLDMSIQGTDGKIDAHDMFDYVHLTQEGYRKIFDPVFFAVSAVLNPDQ
uniref:Major facilitator superfamily (MFS) profile domain-containing protein n=1 Tax=Parascaris univalens TaxID=6257 RepID=A0A915CFM3_PARUN